MVYNSPKLKRKEDRDIFSMSKEELFTAEGAEIKQNKDIYSLPDNNLKAFEKDSQFESKEEKEADIYSLPKEDNEDGSLFRTNEDEVIQDTNDELMQEEIPIKVIDKETLSVNANGKWHTVKREDLLAYQSKFANEDGIDVPITRYRSFSGISGDHESLDKIALDIKNTFAKIDEKLGGFETTQTNY
jgi:hypothetical protein